MFLCLFERFKVEGLKPSDGFGNEYNPGSSSGRGVSTRCVDEGGLTCQRR